MNRFKLPLKHRHPHGVRNAAWMLAALTTACALWFSITSVRAHYLLLRTAECRVGQAEQRATEAERDRDLALAIVQGERPVMTDDGLQVARVKWEKVELVDLSSPDAVTQTH